MTSEEISAAQARKLDERVGFCLRFLNALCARMDRLKFPPTDPVWRAAQRARNEVQGLSVAVHYLTVESGVGKERKESNAKG